MAKYYTNPRGYSVRDLIQALKSSGITARLGAGGDDLPRLCVVVQCEPEQLSVAQEICKGMNAVLVESRS